MQEVKVKRWIDKLPASSGSLGGEPSGIAALPEVGVPHCMPLAAPGDARVRTSAGKPQQFWGLQRPLPPRSCRPAAAAAGPGG
jgi:hypothetical protein